MNMGAFPSGQWGQTVNLLLNASVVRIHQLPPKRDTSYEVSRLFVYGIMFNSPRPTPMFHLSTKYKVNAGHPL